MAPAFSKPTRRSIGSSFKEKYSALQEVLDQANTTSSSLRQQYLADRHDLVDLGDFVKLASEAYHEYLTEQLGSTWLAPALDGNSGCIPVVLHGTPNKDEMVSTLQDIFTGLCDLTSRQADTITALAQTVQSSINLMEQDLTTYPERDLRPQTPIAPAVVASRKAHRTRDYMPTFPHTSTPASNSSTHPSSSGAESALSPAVSAMRGLLG